ncbi:MAG TPA: HD domain-containing protein [Candidatus Nealsonbacteria bacterium]|uniref:HD domain-containing protein n=1 Tax=marine sediment metagenome TaxID=412755 RepID=A0A0F9UZH2_9ZZZZ|nr:HD domain-containing protein [Candidatus Nealsonbacteria bacterium]HEB46776.1 HD domain-containing protein [Candidatus Nealsonbacteria bacterium]
MKIPKEVKFIIDQLNKRDFEGYIVGGCVRDLLRKAEPEDWDIATNAKPKEISKVFSKSFADNKFGTVTVLTGSENPKLKEIEITPYRIDEKYTDKRHPDSVKWARGIKEDLARRDFTVNAMALSQKAEIIDPFGGQEDLKNKTIRTVGNPQDRFFEDSLRMMRAARFATTLNFKIEKKAAQAIQKNAPWIRAISKERIRDELMKIIMAQEASKGIELLRELKLLKYILPELEEGYRVSQNKHHIYDCYEHSIFSLKYAAKKNFNKYVRLAALFHDIAKPRVKEGEGPDATFYSHEIFGAKMTAQILNRLKFSKKEIEKISKLVRYHLFYYNVDEVSESSVRRLVRQVGLENMDELLQVRMADRIGSGVPKAEPYKLRHLRYVIEKVSQDPIATRTLKVNGNDVMKILGSKPGPKIGQMLDILLSYVLDDPKKNKREFLEKETRKLGKLSEKKLKNLAQKAREEREKLEMKRDKMTKKKYWVT